jgi:hypothetical protein
MEMKSLLKRWNKNIKIDVYDVEEKKKKKKNLFKKTIFLVKKTDIYSHVEIANVNMLIWNNVRSMCRENYVEYVSKIYRIYTYIERKSMMMIMYDGGMKKKETVVFNFDFFSNM